MRTLVVFAVSLCLAGAPLLAMSDETALPTWSVDDPTSMDAAYRAGRKAFREEDYSRAKAIWQPMALINHRDSNYGMGVLYRDGLGVEENHSQALHHFRIAADFGHVKAAFSVGYALASLNQGHESDIQSLKYYVVAAKHCNDSAIKNIRWMLNPARNRLPNRNLAIRWANEIAQIRGDQDALMLAAMLYKFGKTEERVAYAYFWSLVSRKTMTDLTIGEEIFFYGIEELARSKLAKTRFLEIEKSSTEFEKIECDATDLEYKSLVRQTEEWLQRLSQPDSQPPGP